MGISPITTPLLALCLFSSAAGAADCDLPRITPMTVGDVRDCLEWLRIELRMTRLRAEEEQRRLASQIDGLKISNMVLRRQICSMSQDIAVLAKDHKTLTVTELCGK